MIEIFGTRIYGTAIGFSLVFIPIGIIVSNQIYGSFADAEAARQGSSSDCMGSGCFETSFRIFSGMQLGSILFSVILYILMVNKKSDLS